MRALVRFSRERANETLPITDDSITHVWAFIPVSLQLGCCMCRRLTSMHINPSSALKCSPHRNVHNVTILTYQKRWRVFFTLKASEMEDECMKTLNEDAWWTKSWYRELGSRINTKNWMRKNNKFNKIKLNLKIKSLQMELVMWLRVSLWLAELNKKCTSCHIKFCSST